MTIAGHGLINGDLVSVTGLPGIAAPGNSARVVVVDVDRVRLAGLTMNAAYGGAGAVVSGPADSWNTAYFAAAGRLFGVTTLNPDRGLYRLTVTSRGEVVISDNLMRHPGGPPPQHGRVAFCQAPAAADPDPLPLGSGRHDGRRQSAGVLRRRVPQ